LSDATGIIGSASQDSTSLGRKADLTVGQLP
jgi:hypothetical protein